MQLTGPLRPHRDIRRRRAGALLPFFAGLLLAAIGVLGLMDEEAGVVRSLGCCAAGVLGIAAGISGFVVAGSRAKQAASMRGGGTVAALPIRERQTMDNGGWTFVCDHGGAEHVLTIQGEDGWPVLGGPGGTHLGVLVPASGAAPVPFTESGFPFDPAPDVLRAWIDAVHSTAGGPVSDVLPARGKLPYSAKSSGGIGPMTIVGVILCALVLLCGGPVFSVLGAVAAAGLVWLTARTLRAVRSVDVRNDGIAWKRRAGGGTISWDEVGGVAVRAKVRASRAGSSAGDIARAGSGSRAAAMVLDAIERTDDGTDSGAAAERETSHDPVLARLEHIGSRNQRREPVVTVFDRSGAIVLAAAGGLPWRLARVLAAEAVARGIPLR